MSAVPKKDAFLAAFIECAGSVTEAAAAVGIDRGLHYRWRHSDPDYLAAFEAAKPQAAQVLKDEATRRAHRGVYKPVFYKGDQCGEILEYSDGLMVRLLEAADPSFRRHTKIEHSGPDGGPIPVQPGLANLNDDQLAQLTELARILAQSGGARSGEAQAEPEQTGEVLPG